MPSVSSACTWPFQISSCRASVANVPGIWTSNRLMPTAPVGDEFPGPQWLNFGIAVESYAPPWISLQLLPGPSTVVSFRVCTVFGEDASYIEPRKELHGEAQASPIRVSHSVPRPNKRGMPEILFCRIIPTFVWPSGALFTTMHPGIPSTRLLPDISTQPLRKVKPALPICSGGSVLC